MVTDNETPQMPDDDRMTEDEIDQASVGLKGRERWQMAARVAEDRAFGIGWAARMAAESKKVDEADEDIDPMVKCPGCNGTGKTWGYGTQCKRCFGATVVKASTLEPEKTAEEEGRKHD